MKKILLLVFILLSFLNSIQAQTGTDFWFAAPEVSESGSHDRPVYLKITTNDSPAIVTVSQPAQDPGVGLGTPVTISIPANSTVSQDLTSYIDQIEGGIISHNNHNDNVVEKKGLHITSTAAISCYYQVNGMDLSNPNPYLRKFIWNSEIFTLKGPLALGTRFYTPFQNYLSNSFDGWSAMHIVATEDATAIVITPTKSLVGHAAGVSFVILMNRGETYCGRALGQLGSEHPGGTLITANKPIAVTVKDDALMQNTGSDLIGDQLLAFNGLGTDYIPVKGRVYSNQTNLYGDRIIICATQNSTQVYVSGLVVATLNAGQQYNLELTRSLYIKTSFPAYVFHVSGIGDELAGAIVPPVLCTGSASVNFTRETDEPFYMNILVKTVNIDKFALKGFATSTIPDLSFSVVPNSPVPGEWSTASIFYSLAEIQNGPMYNLSNTGGAFHLSILNGDGTSSSCRYGYFSSYNSTFSNGHCLTPSDIELSVVNNAHPNLFPNPLFDDRVFLDVMNLNAQSYKIAIYNTNGSLVHFIANATSSAMDHGIALTGLPQGIYTVRISCDNNNGFSTIWTEKLVKF